MIKRVLIAGGTGLVGSYLSNKLYDKGYQVVLLSRKPKIKSLYKEYYWNVDNQNIDTQALENVDFIVHLAGEGISEKRWTKKRKQQIINSRVKSAQFLFNSLKNSNSKPSLIISASAIGYYGAISSEKELIENDPPAVDFLGKTCTLWEQAADQFESLGFRIVKLRLGIVLSKSKGALEKIITPIKLGIGKSIGTGNQFVPWIHIDDLCNIIIRAIEEETMQGSYNAVSPEYLTNREFNQAIAINLKKKFWLPRIPAFVLKLFLGEMSSILLNGSRVKPDKLIKLGFRFEYPSISGALKNLLS
jgi:uncharacterized protein (TIGR01777 family)